MKTVIMATDPSSLSTAPEESKATKLFARTHSTTGLSQLKDDITNAIVGAVTMPFFGLSMSGLAFFAAFTLPDSFVFPTIIALVFGSLMGLAGVGGGVVAILDTVKLKRHKKKAVPQSITEVTSWLKESYGVKVPAATALNIAEGMSVADVNSRVWGWDFNDEAGKKYTLRCNPEELFYIESADGQKTLTELSENLTETIEGIALYSTSAALTDADTQLLKSIQDKANSLLVSDATVETKTAVEQVTSEALKAVELNEQLVKLIPNSTNEALSSTLQILDTELDGVLQKEATAITREMERQNLYVQSRQQSKDTSKLKLNY